MKSRPTDRNDAANRGELGEALVLNDRIRMVKEMSIEEIDEMIQHSDLYSSTVKRLTREFSYHLKARLPPITT